MRLLLGLLAHPVQRVDRLAVGGQEILDQRFHAGLVLGRKVLVDVELADALADRVLDRGDRALPARPVLRNAAQRGAVEREVLVDVGLRQRRRGVAQQLPVEVLLPDRQRGRRQHLREAAEVGRLADNHGLQLAVEAGGLDPRGPVVARRELGQLRQRLDVVGLDRIAVLDLGPLHLGQRGLEGDDVLGDLRRVLVAGDRRHLLDVRLVLGQRVLHLGVVGLEVVVAVRQAEARLVEIDDVLGRVLRVLVHVRLVGHVDADGVEVRDQCGNLLLVLERGDLREVRLERLEPQLLDLGLVHEAVVEVADLLGVGVAAGGLGRVFDDAAQLHLGVVGDLVEAAVARLVGRDLEGVEPLAVLVTVEVVLLADGVVVERGVDTGHQGRLGFGRGGGGSGFGLRRFGRLRAAGGEDDAGRAENGAEQVTIHEGFLFCWRPRGAGKARCRAACGECSEPDPVRCIRNANGLNAQGAAGSGTRTSGVGRFSDETNRLRPSAAIAPASVCRRCGRGIRSGVCAKAAIHGCPG